MPFYKVNRAVTESMTNCNKRWPPAQSVQKPNPIFLRFVHGGRTTHLVPPLCLLTKTCLTTCCPNGRHVSSLRSLLQNNMDPWIKVRGLFSSLVALYSHAILLFPYTSLTPLHTLDQLPWMCVFVSWSVAITKWRPLLTRRPRSSCSADLLLNSLVTSMHTQVISVSTHTNATSH